MERMDTQSHNDFLNTAGHSDTHSAPPLRESIGSLQHGDIPNETTQSREEMRQGLNDNRMISMLESIGVPRSTSESVMMAVTPRVRQLGTGMRNSSRSVSTFVRRHPARIVGAVSALTAGIVGWKMYSARKRTRMF